MDESMYMEGTLDTVEFALINLVKGYPELYNSHDPANRDKRKKDLAWAEIARQLSKDEGWCYAKWKNLTDYYKKRKKIYGNGASVTMRRWVYFDALSFLDIYDNGRDDSNSNHEHSQSSTDCNQNYFDETQYQSLDGITDRAAAEVRLRQFLEPVIETNYRPAKKQRITPTTTYSHPEPLSTNRHFLQQQARTNSFPNFGFSRNEDNEPIHTTLAMNMMHGRTTANKFSSTSTSKPNPITAQTIHEDGRTTPSLNDCPHYHFCISLAARFRNMDPATATFTQMKIMELILKTEFPEEYKRRAGDEQANS